jgi:hypothetical protein
MARLSPNRQPKSPFQIAGAGAVGTGSLRGIPVLHRLRKAGFSVWPFTQSQFPIALEIYPRVFTGPGNKSSKDFRTQQLAQYPELPKKIIDKAQDSEDAFDALCSVIGMKDHANQLAHLQEATNEIERLEGKIWQPAD